MDHFQYPVIFGSRIYNFRMKMNSKRWAIAAVGALGLVCGYLSSLALKDPALAVNYFCEGVKPSVSVYGEGLPKDRFVEVSLMDIENGSALVGSERLRTNKAGKLYQKLPFENIPEGTRFRLEVTGKYPFDDSIAWMLTDTDLKRKIQAGRVIATVEGTVPEHVCRRERF